MGIKQKKINVIVIMGGISHEHDVSLKSGKAVFNNLDKKKYSRRAVIITKNNNVKILPQEITPSDETINKEKNHDFLSAFTKLKNEGIDIALLALHGKGGEDGTIQGFLETIGLPYTHSGVLSSAISMNKIISRYIFKSNGLTIPPGFICNQEDNIDKLISKVDFDFPMIVKPPQLGSSFGIKIVENISQLKNALDTLWAVDRSILIEKFIKGKEFTCVVINRALHSPAEAMPVTEIVPIKSAFFDFEAKYTAGATKEITPAKIPSQLSKKIQTLATKCHNILFCEGVSRTDFILDDKHNLFVLETNTIPGMTETSFVPQVVQSAGMSFGDFLNTLINYELSKKNNI